MTLQIKQNILNIATYLCILLECVGVYKMAASLIGGGDLKGTGYVVAGFIVGIPVALARHYLTAKIDDSLDKDKVAVETLSKLSKGERSKLDR